MTREPSRDLAALPRMLMPLQSAPLALAEQLWRYAPAQPSAEEALRTAHAMRRVGLKLGRLAVVACNRSLTPREEAEEARACEAFRALCASVGCTALVQGDPRGYVARVVFPEVEEEDGFAPRPHNTWGGPDSGWGVA